MFNWLRKPSPSAERDTQPAVSARADAVDASDKHKTRGNEFFAQGRLDEASVCFRQAIATHPGNAAAHFNLGLVLREQGRLDDAVSSFVLAGPGMADALHLIGGIRQRQGNLPAAIENYRGALLVEPRMDIVYGDLCMALFQAGQVDEAGKVIQAGIALNPRLAEFHNHQGNLFVHQQRPADAAASYRRALALHAAQPEVHNNLGIALQALGDFEAALRSFDQALKHHVDYFDAHNNRGVALGHLQRHEEALQSHDRALALNANDASGHANRALALTALRRYDEALNACEVSLRLDDTNAEVHNNLGRVFSALGRYNEALAIFDRALRINPDHAHTLSNRAMTLGYLQRRAEQIRAFEQLLAAAPEYPYGIGFLLGAKIYACDWTGLAQLKAQAENAIRAGRRAVVPFTWLAVSGSAELQWQCSRIHVADKFPPVQRAIWRGERYRHGKIRVAYLSADLHNHATATLMAELFELHDKERFETTALSFGPDTPSDMRSRLKRAFTCFVDVRANSDHEIALLMRELEIDIAVDLKGFTTDARMGIFGHRAAPVQVSYLGYPGTLGADYIDYIVADGQLVSKDVERWYTEKVVYLPGSYQPNDSRRPIASDTCTRVQQGLPEKGFVFCCFNNNYKITPDVFEVWMRLLRQVPKSVLWLLEDHAVAADNLRKEAALRGVAPVRLVFAPRLSQDAHLARHRMADLFLDTLPCNAHTTASDALWAGLPVLTCKGQAFAARVAASLLNSMGLPELITHSFAEYEAKALELARSKSVLGALRERLDHRRFTAPLFNAGHLCRHLESAYTTMWERSQGGEKPGSFTVPSL